MAKNLIVCCDGTWNTPEQREGGLPCPTNVVKLHNLSVEDESQRRYYHPGVGHGWRWKDKLHLCRSVGATGSFCPFVIESGRCVCLAEIPTT